MTIETQALIRLLRVQPYSRLVTQKQVDALVWLFKDYDPKMTRVRRIGILSFLVGDIMYDRFRVSVGSFKNITGEIASVLISQLSERTKDGALTLSEDGRRLLEGIEKDIEASADGGQDRANAAGFLSGVSSMH